MDHVLVPGDAPTAEPYRYEHFRDSYSIRILTLEPGVGDEPLVGSLKFENLDFSPEYEAISYVWGTEGRCSEILIDGRVLPLTRSIEGALRRMRHASSRRRLWADQICINQDDIAERSQQVSLMNAIYKGAQHVLVWLGPDDNRAAQAAVTMVHYLHGVFTNDEMHDEFRLAHSEELLKQDKSPWVPLAQMTRLQWVSIRCLRNGDATDESSSTGYGSSRRLALQHRPRSTGETSRLIGRSCLLSRASWARATII